jgi:hypothetical protein
MLAQDLKMKNRKKRVAKFLHFAYLIFKFETLNFG